MTGENSDAANELGLRLIEAKQALEQSGEEVQKLTQQSQKGEQQLRKLGKSVDERFPATSIPPNKAFLDSSRS